MRVIGHMLNYAVSLRTWYLKEDVLFMSFSFAVGKISF